MSKIRYPKTPEDWQLAVDLAQGALLFLQETGVEATHPNAPLIDVPRCDHLLAEGKRRGFTPSDEALNRYLSTLTTANV